MFASGGSGVAGNSRQDILENPLQGLSELLRDMGSFDCVTAPRGGAVTPLRMTRVRELQTNHRALRSA
jgi:hypothetical protein